jgi:hypothetical protein
MILHLLIIIIPVASGILSIIVNLRKILRLIKKYIAQILKWFQNKKK